MNEGFAYRERIAPVDAGRTVLDHLILRHRHSDAATWRRRVEAGEVELEGRTAEPAHRLRAGDRLVWHRPPWEEPAVPLAFAVCHRDAHVLVVAKPRGLPSIPNGGFLEHTLLRLVGRTYPEATPVHRLGRGTSGLVLFARSDDARRALAAAFREGAIEKTYRALVTGVPDRAAFTVETPIGAAPHPRLGSVHAAGKGGKRAVTRVRVVEPRPDAALVEASIPTGRPHQIRIHLAAAGHPLVGDRLYGPGGVPLAEPALPGDPGYWLHAMRLGFRHPATGAWLDAECAPPPPLRTRDEEGRGAR